jgi:hypothetical protein
MQLIDQDSLLKDASISHDVVKSERNNVVGVDERLTQAFEEVMVLQQQGFGWKLIRACFCFHIPTSLH